jgi:hypothetical protein
MGWMRRTAGCGRVGAVCKVVARPRREFWSCRCREDHGEVAGDGVGPRSLSGRRSTVWKSPVSERRWKGKGKRRTRCSSFKLASTHSSSRSSGSGRCDITSSSVGKSQLSTAVRRRGRGGSSAVGVEGEDLETSMSEVRWRSRISTVRRQTSNTRSAQDSSALEVGKRGK